MSHDESKAGQGTIGKEEQIVLPSRPDGPQRPAPSGWTTTLAGMIAGLLAFALGEVFLDWFPPRDIPQMLSGSVVMKPTVQTIAVADGQNAALTFAFFGAGLGLLIGLASQLANRANRRSWNGPATGLVLGAALGSILPLILVAPYFRLSQRYGSDDLILPLAMHGIFWGSLGAAAGLACGIASGRPGRARQALFGFLGACLGAAIYEVVGATMAPLAATTDPISKAWTTRLLSYVLVGTCTGAALGLSGVSSDRSPGRTGSKTADSELT
jgi:hypothetical protein